MKSYIWKKKLSPDEGKTKGAEDVKEPWNYITKEVHNYDFEQSAISFYSLRKKGLWSQTTIGIFKDQEKKGL